MNDLLDDWYEIKLAIDKTKKYFDSTRLFFVANTKQDSIPTFQYPHHSILTDFYSDQEYSDMLTSFRESASYVEGIIGEAQFISQICKDHHLGSAERTLVYSGPGNSPGRASNLVAPVVSELMGITTCGADPYALALTENKFHCFRLLRDNGIQTPKDWLYDPIMGWVGNQKPEYGLKIIAKPVNGCASIGITDESIGKFDSKMESFIKSTATGFGESFIVQEFIHGYEVEVPIFGLGKILAPMACGVFLAETRYLGDKVLSYESVFDDDYSFYNFAHENKKLAQECCDISILAYKVLSLSGIARLDFRVNDFGIPYVTDITNIPHLTQNSAPSFIFIENGYLHADLLQTLLSIGHDRIDKLNIRPNFNRSIHC